MTDDLDSDERPTIQILGGAFKDVAGNNNVTDSFRAVDKIAPGVTITITSSSGTSNRAATDKKGSFTVRVTSDEDLSKFPRLYFATIEGEASIDENGKVGKADNKSLTIAEPSAEYSMNELDTNSWERKIDADRTDLPRIANEGNGIMAVIVTATDESGNSGNSAGWKDGQTARTESGFGVPGDGEKLDFKKLNAGGFLVEIDNVLDRAKVSVLPAVDPDEEESNETESSNPYIQITFSERMSTASP